MGTDVDNREILKSRLAKGEISVKEFEELQKILNKHLERTAIPTDEFEEIQKILDEHLVPIMERAAIPTDAYYWDILNIIISQLDSATERATIPTDAFEFTGIKKVLLYILVTYSAMWVLIMLVLGYLAVLSSTPSLNEIAKELFKDMSNMDGTIIYYLFSKPPFLIKVFPFVSPFLILYFYFEMQVFKKNKTIKNYNKLIKIADFIIFIEIMGLAYISKENMIDNIEIFCNFALSLFVLSQVYMLPKKKDTL